MSSKKKPSPRKFATFILTHGRADNVLSYRALKKGGYTGQIYLLVDNEDKQLQKYLDNYGDEVIVFDKKKVAESVDACDNYGKRNSVVFARNYNFVIARELGLTHFWQLDDDYPQFGWAMNNDGDYITSNVVTHNLDPIIDACLNFLDDSSATSVAFAQGGDFIGGGEGRFARLAKEGRFSRKAMNSFFFRSDATVTFRGRVNDDVNLYVECGRRGELFVTLPRLRLWQPQTQAEAGGCTDIYLEMGTYIKSFYSVLVAPSCVKIAAMGNKHRRIHHMVQWKYACPVIIDEKYRKPRVA
jgi:hypothetical protein